MERANRPILSYLINTNKMQQDGRLEPKSDISQEEVVQWLAHRYIAAQTTISKAYRRWKLRLLHKNIYLADIYFDEFRSNIDDVYIVGDFTTQPWIDKIRMKYSLYFGCFKTQVRIKNKAEFKFIINGSYAWSSRYKTIICQNFEENNVFSVRLNSNKERRKLFKSKWSKSFGTTQPEYSFMVQNTGVCVNNMNNELKDKDKEKWSKQMRFTQIMSTVKSSKNIGQKIHIKHPWSNAYDAKPHQTISKFKKEVVKAIASSNSETKSVSSKVGTMKSFRSPQKQLEPIFEMVTSVMRNPNNIGDTFDKEYFFSEIGVKVTDNKGIKDHKKSRNSSLFGNKNIHKLKFLQRSSNDSTSGKAKLLKSFSTSSVSEISTQESYKLVSSGYLISKSRSKPSEDAFFIHEKAVGVADGVGGWSRFGIDWSKFSNEIMNRCRKYCERVERFEKFTSDIVLSNNYIENYENIYNSISDEHRKLRLHSNSFWFNQQGQSVDLAISNKTNDFVNKSIEFFSRKTPKVSKSKAFVNLDPKSIIKYSCNSVKSFGSTTVCVSTLQNTTLKVANLGDSGFLLIRYNEVVKHSKVIAYSQEMQHTFNTPYQVTKVPKDTSILGKEYERLSAQSTNLFWNDDPSSSDVYSAKVAEGDILILASDGLYDNLFFDDILDIVNAFMKRKLKNTQVSRSFNWIHDSQESCGNTDSIYTQVNAYELASILAKEAKRRSKWENTLSPFEKRWNSFVINYLKEKKMAEIDQSQRQVWKGGKKDDIWVVVSFIAACW